MKEFIRQRFCELCIDHRVSGYEKEALWTLLTGQKENLGTGLSEVPPLYRMEAVCDSFGISLSDFFSTAGISHSVKQALHKAVETFFSPVDVYRLYLHLKNIERMSAERENADDAQSSELFI